jgi:hypothetical protein
MMHTEGKLQFLPVDGGRILFLHFSTWSQLARQHAMALAGVPARCNKVIVVIRQYGPTFATAHGGIQCDCGGGFPTLSDIYLFRLNYH